MSISFSGNRPEQRQRLPFDFIAAHEMGLSDSSGKLIELNATQQGDLMMKTMQGMHPLFKKEVR